mmetsp:Transcript_70044/g.158373  ORF Transcript_70044/g.158373 Transcript_70044/m.158373 type:complete len:144 (-) Transcript_70044:42-473(-)
MGESVDRAGEVTRWDSADLVFSPPYDTDTTPDEQAAASCDPSNGGGGGGGSGGLRRAAGSGSVGADVGADVGDDVAAALARWGVSRVDRQTVASEPGTIAEARAEARAGAGRVAAGRRRCFGSSCAVPSTARGWANRSTEQAR